MLQAGPSQKRYLIFPEEVAFIFWIQMIMNLLFGRFSRYTIRQTKDCPTNFGLLASPTSAYFNFCKSQGLLALPMFLFVARVYPNTFLTIVPFL